MAKAMCDPEYSDSLSSVGESSVKKPENTIDRASWGGKMEFILTCIGFAIGLGTVWRFPYLCYRNGGGAFLIPYVLMMTVVGLPLFYMELAIGQFASLGPIGVWRMSKFFKGLGFASVIASIIVSIYYNIIIAICFYFLFSSFTTEVPWTHCNNTWNTDACHSLDKVIAQNVSVNISDGPSGLNVTMNAKELKTPAEEFFFNHVLQLTESIGDTGGIRWELAACLLLAWLVVGGVLIKGITSLGKVVYFTASFPYILLTILLIRGILLEGSIDGIVFYLKPQWHKLLEAQVWSDAAVQVFYALSVASGGIIAMSSYNRFNNNILRDSVIVTGTTLITSIWAGFVIFSVLGYMAKIKNVKVEDVAAQGPGLTFVVYPEALSTMPLPPLWSILFFFMMVILGFGSEFSMMECVLTALIDEYPQWFKTSSKREILFRVCACVFCFLCGLPMVTQGGFHLLNLIDNYAGGYPLIVIAICELIAVNWVYGYNRFNADIRLMVGRSAPMFFKLTLCFVAPSLMIGVFGFMVYQFEPLKFEDEVYPTHMRAIGWLSLIVCVGPIPCFAVYSFCKTGAWQILKVAAAPHSLWGPANQNDRIGTIYECNYLKKQSQNDLEDMQSMPEMGQLLARRRHTDSESDLSQH